MRPSTKPLHQTFAVATWAVAYALEHGGNSPAIDEMADGFDVHRNSISDVLNRLYKYGVAERIDRKLCIVGLQVIPPQWYIDNVHPPLSKTDQTENARRNHIYRVFD